MGRWDAPISLVAKDFFGKEIKEGDWVIYPTGGQSCRMVLARVAAVIDLDKEVYDGYRGRSMVKIQVNRYQDGVRKASDNETHSYWKIDSSRKVSIEQLHRVVVVNPETMGINVEEENGAEDN